MKKDPEKAMRIFIERNGKFSNYQSREYDEEASRLREQELEFERQELERLRLEKEKEAVENETRLV